MQLVLLALQIVEEAADSGKASFAFDYQALLLRVQLGPGNIQRNLRLAREALQIRAQRAVFGFCPRLDGALVQGLRLIWNHQIEIEINGVPEALTTGTGTVRIVKRKQPRLGFFVAEIASLAFETVRKAHPFHRLLLARGSLENNLARFAIADFDRIHNPCPRLPRNHQAIHQQKNRLREINVEQRFWSRELEDLALLIKPVEASGAQIE